MILTANPATLNEILRIFFHIVVSGLAVLTLAGLFGRYSHYLDICDQFRMQYLVALVLSCLVLVLLQDKIWTGLAILFAGINLFLLSPLFLKPQGWIKTSPQYRLLLVNVLRTNQNYHSLVKLVLDVRPDFVALVEPDQEWMDALAEIKENYPYCHSSIRLDNYGLAFLSRYPIEKADILYLTEKGIPTLTINMFVNQQPLTFIVSHPPPPKNSLDSRLRDQQLEQLAILVADEPAPIILCGDFNITPWGSSFRSMERHGNLIDSSRGFGYQPTWPSGNPLLRVPIDQCLVSQDISIIERRIGLPIGSDHFPVIIDFCFKSTVSEF